MDGSAAILYLIRSSPPSAAQGRYQIFKIDAGRAVSAVRFQRSAIEQVF
jgi:hypothetical protein